MLFINKKEHVVLYLFLQWFISDAYQQNSKFLGNDEIEDRRLGKRKRPSSQGSNPCNFGGGYGRPKNQGTGRTFFDFQFFNVEHNYNLEINCGGNGGGYPSYPSHQQPAPVTEIHNEGFGGGNKPFGGLGGNKPRPPHKPPKPGGGGFFQNLFGGGNRPHQDGDESIKPQNLAQGPFGGFFPSPQEFATGLSDGLQSFIGTLPAIGESFQSILPTFDNFQWPQLPQFNPGGGNNQNKPVPSNPFNGPSSFIPSTSTFPPVFSSSSPVISTTAPTTTTDPDDIIYSDEIKPVNEDYDPITDPYNSKRRPSGANGRYRPNSYYSRSGGNAYQNYRNSPVQYHSRNGNYRNSDRPEGRSFRFPS